MGLHSVYERNSGKNMPVSRLRDSFSRHFEIIYMRAGVVKFFGTEDYFSFHLTTIVVAENLLNGCHNYIVGFLSFRRSFSKP